MSSLTAETQSSILITNQLSLSITPAKTNYSNIEKGDASCDMGSEVFS